MKKCLWFWLLATCVWAFAQPDTDAYVRCDVSGLSESQVTQIKASVTWWVELDQVLLARVDGEAELPGNAICTRLDLRTDDARLGFASLNALAMRPDLELRVLAKGGRWAVVWWPKARLPDRLSLERDVDGGRADPARALFLSFEPNRVLARDETRTRAMHGRKGRADILDLVDEVDADRWFADIEQLAEWDRYTLGSEVLDARDWLVTQFQALPGFIVETSEFAVGDTPAFNVMGTLNGDVFPDRWIVIGAHYDARSELPFLLPAPGAEDNASGTAAVLEMARIFSQHPPPVTLKFICYSGEEQGLWGSEHHVAVLEQSGDVSKVQAAVIMDMVGFSADADLDCLLESNRASEEVIGLFAQAAADYTDLRIVTSFYPFGSDHVPYLNAHIPGLLVIENDWDIYPYYHTSEDKPEHISLPMGREILKMNVAAVATLIDELGSTPEYTYFIPHVPPAGAWQLQAGISNIDQSREADIVQRTVELAGDEIARVWQSRYGCSAAGSRTLEIPGTAQRWIQLNATAELSGTVVFSLNRGAGVERAALPLLGEADLQTKLVFPHVPADRQQFWSGAAFFNPHEAPVSYRIHLYGSGRTDLDGLLNTAFSGPLILEPGAKRIVVFQTTDPGEVLFDDSASIDGVTWVEIETEGGLIGGFELFGKTAASGSTGELASIACGALPEAGLRAVGLNLDEVAYRGFAMLNASAETCVVDLTVYDRDGHACLGLESVPVSGGEKLLGLCDVHGFFFPYATGEGQPVELIAPHVALVESCPLHLIELSGTPGRCLDGMAGQRFGRTAHWGGFAPLAADAMVLHLVNSGTSSQTLMVRLNDANGDLREERSVLLQPFAGARIDLSDQVAMIASIGAEGAFGFAGTLVVLDESASDGWLWLTPTISGVEPGDAF